MVQKSEDQKLYLVAQTAKKVLSAGYNLSSTGAEGLAGVSGSVGLREQIEFN